MIGNTKRRLDKLNKAFIKDPNIFVDKEEVGETFGENPEYLLDIHGLSKSDLIRLERKGLAVKARYETKTGEHRVRWIIFKQALEQTPSA